MISGDQIFFGEPDENGECSRVLAVSPEVYAEPEVEFALDPGSLHEFVGILFRWKYLTRNAGVIAAKGAVIDGNLTGRSMASMSRITGISKQILSAHLKRLKEIAPWIVGRVKQRPTERMSEAAKVVWKRRRKKEARDTTPEPKLTANSHSEVNAEVSCV